MKKFNAFLGAFWLGVFFVNSAFTMLTDDMADEGNASFESPLLKSDDESDGFLDAVDMEVAIPNFVNASQITNFILHDYKQDDYLLLFENHFPLVKFNEVVALAKTILEIKTFMVAPSLNQSVKTKMDKIQTDLLVYMYEKIDRNKETLIPEIKRNWESLSPDQQQLIGNPFTEQKAICCLGKVACTLTTLGILIAFIVAGNTAFQVRNF